MVEVAGANRMMPGVQSQGSADSGYGIAIHGFHCPVSELNARLDELKSRVKALNDIEAWEYNGFVMVLVLERNAYALPPKREVAVLRREPHKFFQDLPKFLSSTKAQFVDRMILTGSMGSISLTLLYRAVEPGV
jgi:hypothetical protein